MEHTTLISTDLSIPAQQVLHFSEERVEPGWLRTRRVEALALFEKTAWPTGKEETWRHSNVRTFLKALQIPQQARMPQQARSIRQFSPAIQNAVLPEEERSALLILSGNHFTFVDIPGRISENAFLLTDLASALDRPEVKEHLFRTEPLAGLSRFEWLHRAFWNTGIFLYVSDGTAIEKPIQILFENRSDGEVLFPHLLFVLGKGSQAKIILEWVSPDGKTGPLNLGEIEVFLGTDSELELANLNRWNHQSAVYQTQVVSLSRNSRLRWLTAFLGGGNLMINQEIRLLEEHSQAEMQGLYYISGNEHVHMNTYQNHVANRTRSNLLYKGILQDTASAVYRGLIKVHRSAQQTDAYQANRNLMLSSQAHVNSMPILEIEANDVRCTHGATMGKIDEDQVFYLQSRGLSRHEAEKLIVDGFVEELIQALPAEAVRERVRMELERKYEAREQG